MNNICHICGAPKEACICKDLIRDEQRISVKTEKRNYGKVVTIIDGFDDDINLRDISKCLKSKLGCGGTIKNGKLELQGKHLKNIKPLLEKLGFGYVVIDD